MDNRIDASFTDEQQATVSRSLEAIAAALPFLHDLSPEERRELYKLGDKSRTFVDAALIVARVHPDVLPRSFDVEQFEADAALHRDLEETMARLEDLLERVDDTHMLAGAEAMEAARAVYHYTKGYPGSGDLNEAARALGTRFARRAASDT